MSGLHAKFIQAFLDFLASSLVPGSVKCSSIPFCCANLHLPGGTHWCSFEYHQHHSFLSIACYVKKRILVGKANGSSLCAGLLSSGNLLSVVLAGKVAMDSFPETHGSFTSQCWGGFLQVPVTSFFFSSFFSEQVNHIVYSLSAKPVLAGLKCLLSTES